MGKYFTFAKNGMQPIRMVDLKTQYLHIKNEIDEAILQVLNSTQFIHGPFVEEFRKNLEQYLGVKHVIPCGNGTDALQVSMMALNLQPGDEVIAPSFTFVATAEVIALLKLRPVLVDVDPKTFNISVDAIKKAITPKTKAIVPVHLFGQAADMEEILAIAREHNLYVIEDACQSIGSDYYFSDGTVKKTGTIGDIGCTSFFPSKNLGAYGDGGAIFTNNDELADKLRMIVNHGMKVRYYHDEIGVNSRLDAIQAAILNVKLKYLEKYIEARRKAADYYDKAFANHPKLITPYRSPRSRHVFHQYTLIANGFNRNELINYLQEQQIPAMIYYPVPMHQQKAYRDPRYKEGDFPVSEWLSKNVFSLPMHTELDEEQLEYITYHVLRFVNQYA